MEAVIAGWVAGYAMGVVATVALTYLAMRYAETGFVRRFVGEGMSPVMLSVAIFMGAVVVWTVIGVLAGVLYHVGDMGGQPDFLGSPAAGFTIGVLAFAWAPVPVLVALARRLAWLWVSSAAVFAGLFGWLLPLLAER